jgi:hypothetical protein
MEKGELLDLFNQQVRRGADWPDTRREELNHLIRQIPLQPGGDGFISYSKLDSSNADAAIQEQVAYFDNLGCDFEWKYYDYDQPPDLKDRLAAHGFEIGEAEAFMILDLDQAPAFFWQPVQRDVRRISDPAHIRDVLAVKAPEWEEEQAEIGNFLRDTLHESPDRISIYVAYANAIPASAAWLSFHPGSHFAGLWGGSTRSEYRGQGLYTALVVARAQEARARQARFLTVDASPMSRPILERFGFTLLAFTYPCVWRHRSLGASA